MATKTDAGATEWIIDGDPHRLRVWANDVSYLLPTEEDQEVIVGSGSASSIRIADGMVSGKHASLTRQKGKMVLRDLKSKNGVRVDGARRALSILEPGMELGFGGTTLVVESVPFTALRAFVSRLVGWSAAQLEAVDLALRAIRSAVARRAPLVLCGDGDLVAVAQSVHRRTLGDDRPFVACDPRRGNVDASVRAAKNFDRGLSAFAAAHSGTLCVWAKRLPKDFAATSKALRAPDARVQLVVCARDAADVKAFEVAPVVLPSLGSRILELAQIVDEYARDARAFLGSDAPLSTTDRDWILSHSALTLADIEKGALRRLALRKAGSVAGAAELLGMSHSSLLRWLDHR